VDQIENNERTVEKRSLDSSVLSQDEQPATKVQRFELGTAESAENDWSLPTSMVEYIHRYMNANIPTKEIKEKILSLNPVPSNIKRVPELDSYIKELLVENNKSQTLQVERTLKVIQERERDTFGPFAKLWAMTEEERPDDDADQITLDTFKEVSNLFEQTSTLLAHASNKLTYQRRFNILSTLIDNNTRVSDLLRTHADILNHKDNNFLFGEKFEEIMVKDCKSKKKSKEMFSGLKRPASSSASGSSSQIPFRQGSLPNRGQRGGGRGRKFFSKLGQKSKFTTSLPKSKNSRAFITTGLPQGSSSSEGYISSQGNSLFASSRQIKVFSKELGVSDSGSSNPGLCSRLSNTFSISSKTTVSPSIKVQSGGDWINRYRNFGDAPKRGYNRSPIKRQSDFKSNFYCTKEGLRIPSGDKLKKPEFTHTICSFQNGGTLSPEGLASGERYNVQTRSESCLFFILSKRTPRVIFGFSGAKRCTNSFVYVLA